MATKKNYSRYFIILQEDEKGFSTDMNKFPTGYTKIEKKNDKCKVSYYVQNLKKDKEPYYMVLICNDKNVKKLIKLGKMNLDDFGSTEISYEYEVSNLANSGIGMDKIKGACIVSFKDGNMRAALIGFINGAKLDNWKSYAIVEPKEKFRNSEIDKNIDEDIKLNNEEGHELKKEKIEVKEEQEAHDREKIEEYEKEVREDTQKEMEDEIKINRSLSENNAFDEYEKDIEKFKNINKEVEDIEKDESKLSEETDLKTEQDFGNQLFTKNEKEDLSDDADKAKDNSDKEEYKEVEERNRKDEERNKKEKDKCKDNEYKAKKDNEYKAKKDKEYKEYKDYKEYKEDKEDYPVGAMGEFFKKMAKELEEVHDVCPEIGKCKWYKISVEQLERVNNSIDSKTCNMLYCPMTYYYPYIKKYGHYLIGYKCDSKGNMKYIVYAIPGTKMVYDQPFGGTTGFTTWTCRKYGDDKMCSMGYWVMFYDFKNCRVMVPVI